MVDTQALLIETSPISPVELDYILGVVFGEFLGLPWKRIKGNLGEFRIRLQGETGEIHLPDVFMDQFRSAWLTSENLPTPPCPIWDTRDLGPDIRLVDPYVPVLFGAVNPATHLGADSIALPIDLFGSAFFMLSRYEEAVQPERDDHDRFPATASLAHRAGFLDRPIVDEYVEILWTAMQRLWPGLERKPRQPRTLMSCDVDSPFAFSGRLGPMFRRGAGDLLKRRAPSLAWRNLLGEWRAWRQRGDTTEDPYRAAIAWIMDINERAGRSVAFYFIPENTDPRLDNRVSLDDPCMRALLRDIHARGHEIGLHPGYNTYKHPEALARSVATMRRVLDAEGINQPQLGGRQHFLRWETPTTARLWDNNGLDYDSTMSFADRPGFRCGTCREYPLYDLTERRALRLRERPLIVMECAVIADRYLGLGYSDAALALMQGYRDICHRFSGDFTLLWHNSHLGTDADRRFYADLSE